MRWSDEQFSGLFSEHYQPVFRYLSSLTADEGLAQDLTQEVFLRLYRLGPRRIDPDGVRFWSLRVGRNLALNEIARHARWRRIVGLLPAFLSRAVSDPASQHETREQLEAVDLALLELPEQRRAALLLREQQGLSYREIAGALGVTVAKVKVDIHRARQTLRKRLHDGGALHSARVTSRANRRGER